MRLITLEMAWRNLWRNPRRTLITGSGVGLGLAFMVFMTGYSEGMSRYMVGTVTRSLLGEAQLHAEGYRATREPERVLPDGETLAARALGLPDVRGAAPRLYGDGLLAIGDRAEGVVALGIDPRREAEVTDWHRRLTSGVFLAEGESVLLGRDLARALEAETGSKLVLTLADARTGDLHYYLVTVAGILFTNNPLLDRRAAVLPLPLVRDGLGLPGGVHEIALALDVPPSDRAAIEAAIAPLAAPGVEVSPWQEIVPVIGNLLDMMDFYTAITLSIIFVLLAFGIVNTMSMALLERFREFGILRALGTEPRRLFALILGEAACLGAVGSALGLALGLAVHAVVARAGITFGGVEAMGVTFEAPLYPVLNPLRLAWVTAAFLALAPLTAAFVARRAARVDPARALRRE